MLVLVFYSRLKFVDRGEEGRFACWASQFLRSFQIPSCKTKTVGNGELYRKPVQSECDIAAVVDGLKLRERHVVKRHTIVPKASQLLSIPPAVTDQFVEVPATDQIQVRDHGSQPPTRRVVEVTVEVPREKHLSQLRENVTAHAVIVARSDCYEDLFFQRGNLFFERRSFGRYLCKLRFVFLQREVDPVKYSRGEIQAALLEDEARQAVGEKPVRVNTFETRRRIIY